MYPNNTPPNHFSFQGDPNSYPYWDIRGNSKYYAEPDYMGGPVHNAKLPVVAGIGAGPQGIGVYPEIIIDEDGRFEFGMFNDETQELFWQSPNLSAGKITITQPDYTPVPGESAEMLVTIKKGVDVTSTVIKLPPGSDGSRIFMVKDVQNSSANYVYRFTLQQLFYDGSNNWRSKPLPRVNDVVFFNVLGRDANDPTQEAYFFAAGHVEAVEGGNVVVTSTTLIQAARGPQGIKGDKGTFSSPQIESLPAGSEWTVTDLTPDDSTNLSLKFGAPLPEKGDKGTFDTPTIQDLGATDSWTVADLSTDPTVLKLHFGAPKIPLPLPVQYGGGGGSTASENIDNWGGVSALDGYDIPDKTDIYEMVKDGHVNYTCRTAETAATLINAPWTDASFTLKVGSTSAGSGRAKFLVAISAHKNPAIMVSYTPDYTDDSLWTAWRPLYEDPAIATLASLGISMPDGTTLTINDQGVLSIHNDILARLDDIELMLNKQIYVSSSGSDTTGTGSLANPFASLAKGCEKVPHEGTIWILTDIDEGATLVIEGGKDFSIRFAHEDGSPHNGSEPSSYDDLRTITFPDQSTLEVRDGNIQFDHILLRNQKNDIEDGVFVLFSNGGHVTLDYSYPVTYKAVDAVLDFAERGWPASSIFIRTITYKLLDISDCSFAVGSNLEGTISTSTAGVNQTIFRSGQYEAYANRTGIYYLSGSFRVLPNAHVQCHNVGNMWGDSSVETGGSLTVNLGISGHVNANIDRATLDITGTVDSGTVQDNLDIYVRSAGEIIESYFRGGAYVEVSPQGKIRGGRSSLTAGQGETNLAKVVLNPGTIITTTASMKIQPSEDWTLNSVDFPRDILCNGILRLEGSTTVGGGIYSNNQNSVFNVYVSGAPVVSGGITYNYSTAAQNGKVFLSGDLSGISAIYRRVSNISGENTVIDGPITAGCPITYFGSSVPDDGIFCVGSSDYTITENDFNAIRDAQTNEITKNAMELDVANNRIISSTTE